MLNNIAFIVLISSAIGIGVILYKKIPLLIKLSSEDIKNDIKKRDFYSFLKGKIKSKGLNNIVKENKAESFSDDYWQEIKKITKK